MLVLALPAAHAEVTRTGTEPWYQQSTAEARQGALALFSKAIDNHDQLLREEAVELYEQALEKWDNPDIRWNLGLVFEDLGQYLLAHQQFDGVLRWGEALGAERLRDVRARMRALETQRVAWIEADSPEPRADIKLDGQSWFRGAVRRSKLVLLGMHFVVSTKPGYFPVTRAVYMQAGKTAHVALPMDADRLIETRRWTAWKPWAVVAAGVAVTASSLEVQAFEQRTSVVEALKVRCHTLMCEPVSPPANHTLATGVAAVGGTVVVVGLALAWLNQPILHRSEARRLPGIEFTPILSPQQAEVSALVRF
jgi:hypothetical protein